MKGFQIILLKIHFGISDSVLYYPNFSGTRMKETRKNMLELG